MKRKKVLTALACVFAIAALVFAMAACQSFESDTVPGGSIVVGTYPTTAELSGSEEDAPPSQPPQNSSDAETTADSTDATALGSPTVVPGGNYIFVNPLTGESAALDPTGLRPIAVVVDNAAGALAHQSGIKDADILYETLTAPGITRFLAIYSDYRLIPDVCNVRAGREHDVKIAANYNAVLISHGGLSSEEKYDFYAAMKALFGSSDAFIDASKDPAWSASDGSLLKTIVYYDENYRADLKYDTIVTKDAIDYSLINSAFANAGYTVNGDAVNPFTLSDKAADGENGASVTLNFTATGVNSSLVKTVTFKYSAESGSYLRFEDSRPHIDSLSGEQLSFTNVIALLTDVSYIAGESDVDPLTTFVKIYGSGTGYYFSGGKYVPLIWINTAETGLKLYTSGGELVLSNGNTYVGYLNGAYADPIKITP